MNTKTVEWTRDDRHIRLVVGEATALAGMRRNWLRGTGYAFLRLAGAISDAPTEDDPEDDKASPGPLASGNGAKPRMLDQHALRWLAIYAYPDLIAATEEAEGLDLDMAVREFCALPDTLVTAWENAVYELNPHWLPFRSEADAEQEKKGSAPTSAASESS